MEKLQAQLNLLLTRLNNEAEVKARLESLVSVYPFNEFEYLIATLLGAGVLSLESHPPTLEDLFLSHYARPS